MAKIENIVGNKYGRLLVLEYKYRLKGIPIFRCLCECGIEKDINGYSLKEGKTLSCGCLHSEIIRAIRTTHGLSGTRLYQCYRAMKGRCSDKNNKDYELYGGRGISYDPKWSTFDGFFEDMGETYADDLELDRIDVDGNYCKENCRWATGSEQSYNKRLTKSNKSGKAGVSYVSKTKKWKAAITKNFKSYHLGFFDELDDAIQARLAAELELYGYNVK